MTIKAALHPAQRIIHDSTARFRVVSAGRRFGKTRLGVNECLACAAEGGVAWWVAPTYSIARVGWAPLRSIAAQIPGTTIRDGDMIITLPNGGSVAVRSANNPDTLRGYGLDFAVLDEAAYIQQEAWFEVLRPALSDRLGRALFISTPNGQNWFWHLHNRRDGDWQSFQFPTSANPYIAPSEIETAKTDMAEIVFRQEYLAEFVDNEGAVFRRVRECATSEVVESYAAAPTQYVAAVDPAAAQDYTAISVMDVERRCQVYLDRFNRVDYPVLQERLISVCQRYNISRLRIEINGIGRPVFDALAAAGLPVEAFTTTNATKSAIIQGLMSAFEHGEIAILDDRTQIAELLSFEARKSPSGAVTYSAPDGVHDDTVMALAMALDMIETQPWLMA